MSNIKNTIDELENIQETKKKFREYVNSNNVLEAQKVVSGLVSLLLSISDEQLELMKKSLKKQ